MKKIPTLFVRDFDAGVITPDVTPGCEWVIAGEGVATEKVDGTACLVRDGKLYKRYDAKHGKTPPPAFEPAQDAPDPITGHWPGWIAVGDGPDDKWHRLAWAHPGAQGNPDGTYELVGPNVQGNPYGLSSHILVKHGGDTLEITHLTFDGIKGFLAAHEIEGIVWHHEDGRMAKVKRRDLGLDWPAQP